MKSHLKHNNCLYLESKTFLKGLLSVEDKLSMAFSLENRVPFLDNELVDFACRLPVKYKIGNLGNPSNLDENNVLKKKEKSYFRLGICKTCSESRSFFFIF